MNKVHKSVSITANVDKNLLYFFRDKLIDTTGVYAGHSGTGSGLKLYQSDLRHHIKVAGYTYADCEALIKKIEKAAKGQYTFDWEIVPAHEVKLYGAMEKDKTVWSNGKPYSLENTI